MSIANGLLGSHIVYHFVTFPLEETTGLSNRKPPTRPTGQTETFCVFLIYHIMAEKTSQRHHQMANKGWHLGIYGPLIMDRGACVPTIPTNLGQPKWPLGYWIAICILLWWTWNISDKMYSNRKKRLLIFTDFNWDLYFFVENFKSLVSHDLCPNVPYLCLPNNWSKSKLYT